MKPMNNLDPITSPEPGRINSTLSRVGVRSTALIDSGDGSNPTAKPQTYQHVVNLSGGVCSFWCAHRVIEKYGRDGVALLFADVMMEDEDLYRFNGEAEQYLGIPITRISLEMTPWELFEKQGMIGNSRSPLCSVMLKREMLDKWHRQHTLEMTTTLHIGIDWTEEHRLHALREAKPFWKIDAPMCEPELWDKCRMLEELRKIGIEPPRLYKLGFPHNNCGGFCVKAGHAQFALLLRTMPERYAWHEAQEKKLRNQVGDFSVMTDRRGDGKKKPLTMKAFRERVEAGESFDRHDWGGCGCALDPGAEAPPSPQSITQITNPSPTKSKS